MGGTLGEGSADGTDQGRLNPEEAERYWTEHARRRAPLDLPADPDGLNNVCHPGAPRWLNEHYARGQQRSFNALLEEVPPPAPGARALDVGCGLGRWCRRLSSLGYAVTGIDLQPEAIEANRRRHPEMTFAQVSVVECVSEDSFDLITSVTVLGHVPYQQQLRAVRNLRDLAGSDARAMILENIHDRAPHVYARSQEGWVTLFADAGWQLERAERYDFNPALRLLTGLKRRLGRPALPTDENERRPPSARRFAERAMRIAWAFDRVIEPWLVGRQPPLPAVHCGFLFRAATPNA